MAAEDDLTNCLTTLIDYTRTVVSQSLSENGALHSTLIKALSYEEGNASKTLTQLSDLLAVVFESCKEMIDSVFTTNLYATLTNSVQHTALYPADLISGVAFACAWFACFSMVYYFTILPSFRGIYLMGIRSGRIQYSPSLLAVPPPFESSVVHRKNRSPRNPTY